MASLFSVFLALMPLMTLQTGIIQQSCNNGDSACSAKANSLLQVQRGDASQTKLHKVVTADPGDYSEVGINEDEEEKGTTPGDHSEQGKGDKQEKAIRSQNEENPGDYSEVGMNEGEEEKGTTPGDHSEQGKGDKQEKAIQSQNEENPGDYSEVGMNEGDEEKGTTPGDNSEQGKGDIQEKAIQSQTEEEPEKGATPGDNSEQEKADKEEQEMAKNEEGLEDGEGELEGEAGWDKDEEGEESSQENNEVEGHAKPSGESVPPEEDEANYICFNYGKYFSTASDAEGYFHTQCVQEYGYKRALCDELSEKVFEKWEQDRSASWKPDSDMCAEINALLRADIARRHEIGLKPAVASPPKLELLERSKLSHSGKSARSLDETNVLKNGDGNHAPIPAPYPR